MPESRKALRQSRYKVLRSAGYTPAMARHLRDRSPEIIDRAVTERQSDIQRIPARKRTKLERENLAAIQRHYSSPVESRTAISTRSQRLELFSEWSGVAGFPDNIAAYIRRINRDNGLRPRSSYGYRVFYHEFVFGRAHQIALEVGQRADTR